MNTTTNITAANLTVGDVVVHRYTVQDGGTLGAMRLGNSVEVVDEMEVSKILGMGSSVDRRGLRSTWKRTDSPAPFVSISFKTGRSWIISADTIVEVAR